MDAAYAFFRGAIDRADEPRLLGMLEVVSCMVMKAVEEGRVSQASQIDQKWLLSPAPCYT
jgi:hypothetical protein